MNEEAIEKMKIDKIKESISETEEEIAVEIFVNVVEEENVREEEIIEKIEKCEKLKREYIEKIEKLRQKSNEENSCYDKVTANLSEEIDKLRKMKAKLENKRINAGRKVGATSSAADDNEKINRKIAETNKAREAGVAAASANEKIEREIAETNKAREADVAATSAKEKAGEEAFVAKKADEDALAAKKAKEAFAKTEEEAAAAKKVQEEAAVAKKKAIDEVAKKVEAKTFAVKKMVEEAAAEKAAEEVATKEAAKTRRKDTSAVEREANVKETYGDVLEHDIKLLPNHAQLGNEVMIEVAAAFPLLQAQRGESVAPSLNLPQVPTKDKENEANESSDEGHENQNDGKTKSSCLNMNFEKYVVCCEKAVEVIRGNRVNLKLEENGEAEAILEKAFIEHVAPKARQELFKTEKGIRNKKENYGQVMEYFHSRLEKHKDKLPGQFDPGIKDMLMVIDVRANRNVFAINHNQFVECMGTHEVSTRETLREVAMAKQFEFNAGSYSLEAAEEGMGRALWLKDCQAWYFNDAIYKMITQVVDKFLVSLENILQKYKAPKFWITLEDFKDDEEGTSYVRRCDSFDPGGEGSQELGQLKYGPQFSGDQRKTSAQLRWINSVV